MAPQALSLWEGVVGSEEAVFVRPLQLACAWNDRLTSRPGGCVTSSKPIPIRWIFLGGQEKEEEGERIDEVGT